MLRLSRSSVSDPATVWCRQDSAQMAVVVLCAWQQVTMPNVLLCRGTFLNIAQIPVFPQARSLSGQRTPLSTYSVLLGGNEVDD